MSGPAWPGIAAKVRRLGPVPFSVYMHDCLYGPEGFYTRGRGAGRDADFITSPEVSPLFGAVVAEAVDTEWRRCGEPDPWVVVDAGAGRGGLTVGILRARPACAAALRLVAAERSPALRAVIGVTVSAAGFEVAEPSQVLGAAAPVPEEDVAERAGPHQPRAGPLATVLAELPAGPLRGVIVANELLDNLPIDVCEWRDGRWLEVRVGVDETGEPVEVLVPGAPGVSERCTARAGAALPDGTRIPLQSDAAGWVRTALSVLELGRLVIFDYGAPTADLARRPAGGWLRTYRQHAAGGSPLGAAGDEDLTCDVAVDQLPAPASCIAQAEWLARHGLDRHVAAARARWAQGAARPDLEALAARSRVTEAAALTDPDGLGGFRVLEWAIG